MYRFLTINCICGDCDFYSRYDFWYIEAVMHRSTIEQSNRLQPDVADQLVKGIIFYIQRPHNLRHLLQQFSGMA